MYALTRTAPAVAVALGLLLPSLAAAQTPAGSVPALRFNRATTKEAAARLSQASGVLVVADKTVAAMPLTLEVPPGSLDAALTRLTATLPKGAVVKKVLLPALAPGAKAPEGDIIAALVTAQESLAGGAATGAGEALIQGRRVPADKAAPLIAALDLKPVYLITNPAAASDPIQKFNTAQWDNLQTWMNMTPEQQKAAFDQQFEGLMNMDPALRQQLFGQQRQMMMGMMQKIQAMPEDQRAQFMRDLTGGAGDGRGTPPRGPGGPGGGGGPGPGGPGRP